MEEPSSEDVVSVVFGAEVKDSITAIIARAERPKMIFFMLLILK